MHCPIGHEVEEDIRAEQYPDDLVRVYFYCDECNKTYDTVIEPEEFIEC